jgi:photosystem II stability/assembly factor-like uncharacterized protein
VIAAAAFLFVTAGLAWGITSLPVAPNVTPHLSSGSTSGTVARLVETLTYVTPQVAWAVVPSRPYWSVVRSTDAGQHWVDVTPTGDGTNGGVELTVLSATEAIVSYRAYQFSRDSAFAITTDGGHEWTAAILPNAVSSGPDPVAEGRGGEIWAVLGSGDVVSSTDGGGRWSTAVLPTSTEGSCVPTSVRFTSALVGWVSGQCHGAAVLWRTDNGGSSWQQQVLQAGYHRSATIVVGLPQVDETGLFTTVTSTSAGGGSVAVFSDSNTGWASTPSVSLPAGRLITSFANGNEGWIVDAPSGAATLALAYQTSNGGINWSLRSLPMPASGVTATDVVTEKSIWILSQTSAGAELWSTTDGGRSWDSGKLHVISGPPPLVNGVTS